MSFAQDLNQHVKALEVQFHAALADGFDLSEVIALLMQGAMSFTQVARQYNDIPNERKQKVIVLSLRRLYMSRHVDLPWIPEPFESMLENLLFTIVIPQLVKALMSDVTITTMKAANV